jgi:hypothetical protein
VNDYDFKIHILAGDHERGVLDPVDDDDGDDGAFDVGNDGGFNGGDDGDLDGSDSNSDSGAPSTETTSA